ncbi:MAG: methylmalonyl-CoA mutase family protein, partial [Gemmatimonadales bacterium]
YYVERLTDDLETAAAALMEEVDALGGAASAIERGFFQEHIARSAWALQQAQEAGEMTVVGVNAFTDDSEPEAIELPDYTALESRQKERLLAAREARDNEAVGRTLEAVSLAAGGQDSLMPPIIEAVRARATLGEISDVLREVWGTYRTP